MKITVSFWFWSEAKLKISFLIRLQFVFSVSVFQILFLNLYNATNVDKDRSYTIWESHSICPCLLMTRTNIEQKYFTLKYEKLVDSKLNNWKFYKIGRV